MAATNEIASGVMASQPANQNLLSPLGFRFGIARMPGVNWSCQSVNLPGVSLAEAVQETPFIAVPLPGTRLTFDTLSITFKVDEDLANWTELFNWLVELGTPQSYDQYEGIGASDATLLVLNSNMNPNFELSFYDCWPASISDLAFDTTSASVEYITCTATFKFRDYEFRKLNEGAGSYSSAPQVQGFVDEVIIVPLDDLKALDFTTGEHLRNTTAQSIGIANEWSVQVNYKPSSLSFQLGSFSIGTDNIEKDMIRFDIQGSVANDPLRIRLTEFDTTVIKEYDFDSVHGIGTRISVIATWDGTDLTVYIDGVETAATTKITDGSGTMLDTDRHVAIGGRTVGTTSMAGEIHSVSVWNVVLTQAAVTVLQNGGSPQSFDNTFDNGNYASSLNLQHYWRCGFDAADIGKDYGNASTLIDVGDDAENITSDDIVTY